MPFDKRFQIFGRYDVYDNNTNVEDTDETITTFGGSYYLLDKNLMFWAAVENTNFEKNAGEENHVDYMTGLQIKFP